MLPLHMLPRPMLPLALSAYCCCCSCAYACTHARTHTHARPHTWPLRFASPQLFLGGSSSSSSSRSWLSAESDAVGPAEAIYSVRRGLGVLRGQTVLKKRLSYATSPAVPRGFKYEVNATAIYDGADLSATAAHAAPSVLRMSALFSPVHAELRGDHAHDTRGDAYEHEGFDFLPTEPSEAHWRRVGSRPLPPHARALHEAPLRQLHGGALFVSAKLLHVVAKPSVAEMRATMTQARRQTSEEEDGDDEGEDAVVRAGCDASSLSRELRCLLAPLDEEDMHDASGRTPCVEALVNLVMDERATCYAPVLTAVEALLHSQECSEGHASRCSSVINALHMLGGAGDAPAPLALGACEAFSSFLLREGTSRSARGRRSTTNEPHAAAATKQIEQIPRAAYMAAITWRAPCPSLVNTLASLVKEAEAIGPEDSAAGPAEGENAEEEKEGVPPRRRTSLGAAAAAAAATPATHEPGAQRLLLVAAAVAKHAATKSAATAAVDVIHTAVRDRLRAAIEASKKWDAVHARASQAAHFHWHQTLTHHEREGWVQHHAQLKRGPALRWAAQRKAHWQRHETDAKEALRVIQLHADPDYSEPQELDDTRALIASLRASGNLGLMEDHPHAQTLMQATSACLDHRSAPVVEAAADALRSHPHPTTEVKVCLAAVWHTRARARAHIIIIIIACSGSSVSARCGGCSLAPPSAAPRVSPTTPRRDVT